jgi:hypothetical protein
MVLNNGNIWKFPDHDKRILRSHKMSNESFTNNIIYNIAFVNSERWLAMSRDHITQCGHGKIISLYSSCYIIKKIKLFPYWYTVIPTLVDHEIWKTRNYVKTLRPAGVLFPRNFSFSQFSLVLKLYVNTENVLYFWCRVSLKLCAIVMSGENSHLSYIRYHRVNFPGGVYDLSSWWFIVLSQWFEGYLGNFSCLI